MTTLGDVVRIFLGTAQREVLIVAPFIRSVALARILENIGDDVETTVVTRWRAADVLSGASDLDVFNLTTARGIRLLLRYNLHAKLFAADDSCIVGSANITESALGWREPGNLELLTTIPRMTSDIVAFEQNLLTSSIEATEEIRDQVGLLAERLRDSSSVISPESDDGVDRILVLPGNWLPRTMNPEELYSVYLDGEAAGVSRTALPTMQKELRDFGIAPGMTESEFRTWVAAAILQTPLVDAVIRHIENVGSIAEVALERLLTEIDVNTEEYPARSGLLILERWLTYFLSGRYQTTPDSIKLVRAERL